MPPRESIVRNAYRRSNGREPVVLAFQQTLAKTLALSRYQDLRDRICDNARRPEPGHRRGE